MQPLQEFAEKGMEGSTAEWKPKCLVPFSSHTHMQAAGRCVFSQGHQSVLEEKPLLKVAISHNRGVPIVSVPRVLWVTCKSQWLLVGVFLTERQSWLVLQREEHTSSLVCGGLGWEHQLHFLFNELLQGKIMKPKSCFTTITFFSPQLMACAFCRKAASWGRDPWLKTAGGFLKTLTWSLPGTTVSRCPLHP